MARRGENIHKRKDGRWEGRYISDRLPNGKAKYSSVYGKSYRQVKEKLIEQKIASKTSTIKKAKNIPFCDLLNIWLKANTPGLKESTVIKYSALIDNHIVPELGDYCVSNLNSSVLNTFIENKMSGGRLDGKGGISNSYGRTIMIIIKSSLEYAISENLCEPILLSNIFVPKTSKYNVDILNETEQKILEKHLFSNIDYSTIGIILSLYTGLRKGEICALKWDDIDLCKKMIYVKRTLSLVKNQNGKGTHFETNKPKTASSTRNVPVPTAVVPFIKEAKKAATSEYVVSNNRDFVNPRTYEYRFHKIIKQCGIEDFNFHKLRHTFATRCVDNGVDPKTLSEVLGHSSVSITLDLYVHPSMKQKTKQLNKLNKQIA